jgi:hypothetical protein
MRTVIRQSAWTLGLLLAASTAWAQPAEKPAGGGIHRMVIYNGPARAVHYVYGPDVAPADVAAARDLERAENEVALADELQQLKLEYVRNERDMEAHRHALQRLLYGYSSVTYGNPLNLLGGGWAWGGYYPGYGNYYSGYAWPYWGGYSSGYGSVNSLANGVGDEGVIKTTLAGSALGLKQALPAPPPLPGPEKGPEKEKK